jgi:hypothetical protein
MYCVKQADRLLCTVFEFNPPRGIVFVQKGPERLIFIGEPIHPCFQYRIVLVVFIFESVVGGEMIAVAGGLKTIGAQVKLGLVLIWRSAGGAEGGTVAAFVAVVANI